MVYGIPMATATTPRKGTNGKQATGPKASDKSNGESATIKTPAPPRGTTEHVLLDNGLHPGIPGAWTLKPYQRALAEVCGRVEHVAVEVAPEKDVYHRVVAMTGSKDNIKRCKELYGTTHAKIMSAMREAFTTSAKQPETIAELNPDSLQWNPYQGAAGMGAVFGFAEVKGVTVANAKRNPNYTATDLLGFEIGRRAAGASPKAPAKAAKPKPAKAEAQQPPKPARKRRQLRVVPSTPAEPEAEAQPQEGAAQLSEVLDAAIANQQREEGEPAGV